MPLGASCTLALSSIPAISLKLQMPLPLSRHTAGHLQLLPKVVVLTIFSRSPWTLQPLLWLVFPLSRDPWLLGKEPHTRTVPRTCGRSLTRQRCPGSQCCNIPINA